MVVFCQILMKKAEKVSGFKFLKSSLQVKLVLVS